MRERTNIPAQKEAILMLSLTSHLLTMAVLPDTNPSNPICSSHPGHLGLLSLPSKPLTCFHFRAFALAVPST